MVRPCLSERPSGGDAGENILMIDGGAKVAYHLNSAPIVFGGDEGSPRLQDENVLNFERPNRRNVAPARQGAIDESGGASICFVG